MFDNGKNLSFILKHLNNNKGTLMKIYLLLGLLFIQNSYANPEWNLNPKLEQQLIQALDVSSSFYAKQSNKASINFVTVGGDSTCDFRVGNNKIQSAIDSGANEIRIASNDVYQELITINNPLADVTLRGGFSTCTAAANNLQSDLPADWTEITRPNGQSASIFTIVGLISNNKTVFENIKIVGGDGQGSTGGGSIRIENTESDVLLKNVRLTGGFNMATGGGLSILSSNTTVILRNTSIDNNQTSSNGGGLYCNDFSGMSKFVSIILDTNSAITGNTSQFNGGGAYLDQRCLLSVFSGSSTPFPIPKNKSDSTIKGLGTLANNSGVTLNNANGFGGGVYLSGGAGLLVYGYELCTLDACFGDNTNPANIIGNTSNANNGAPQGGGGGIYATGLNTDVTISAGLITDNKVVFYSGGAIALLDNASLTVNILRLDCWDAVRCNYFSTNTAGQNGGVIYNDNATANISHAYFEGSRASIGVVMYSINNALTKVETSVFNHNGLGGDIEFFDNALIFATSGADMEIKYVTIADNDVTLGVFRVENDIGTSLLLNSSIVDDVNSGSVIADSGVSSGFVFANCVMAHETNSLNDSNNTVDDPEFVNRVIRDYHLSNTSPAIDYCNTLTTSSNKDIDFQGIGWDNPSLSNFLGPYDIGADESFPKEYFTIGSDAACDFNSATQTIQDVIDTGIGEVRIAHNGFYDSAIVIDDISIKLRGGYLDCTAADANNATTHTTIDAPGGVNIPTIDVKGTGIGNVILIEHLTIIGNEDTNFSAISAISAVAKITLNDLTVIRHNIDPFTFGGGVNLSGGAIELLLNDTLIIQNSAFNGGGIFCDGTFSKITVTGDSGISHNTAEGKGGGIYLTNGCELTMYSGVSNPDASTNFGLSDNQAAAEGGGIYADNGAIVTLYGHEKCENNICIGNNTNPVNVNNNRSDSDSSGGERGGGIYLTGISTKVNVYAGLFSENTSPNGGAIYVNDFASLLVERLSKECWNPVKCNYFFKNRALGAGTGGALQNDEGFLKISSAYFEENDGRTGSVLYAFGSNSHNTFEGSVFNHNNNQGNGDNYVIRAAASSSVEISYSTFADNYIANSSVFGITSDSTLSLYTSIVNEPEGDVLAANPGSTDIFCIMAHELDSFTGSIRFLGDPLFVNRTVRDYHLSQISPAIDACNDIYNATAIAKFKDIDFETRGIDNLNNSNALGVYDLGADEVVSELIFSNGFE